MCSRKHKSNKGISSEFDTKGDMMALPKGTTSARKAWKEWIETKIHEIESESKHSYGPCPDWVPMLREIAEYAFMLEERITKMELS